MDDLISRQQAIDAVETVAKSGASIEDIKLILAEMPSVQPETNCSEIPNNSDTISRRWAIDKITKRLYETAFNNIGIKQNIDETLVDVAENRLENWFDELPSVQPERKKGTWTDDASCPFCGFQPWYEKDIHTLSFCPNCGADMRGDKHETEGGAERWHLTKQ